MTVSKKPESSESKKLPNSPISLSKVPEVCSTLDVAGGYSCDKENKLQLLVF